MTSYFEGAGVILGPLEVVHLSAFFDFIWRLVDA